MAIIYSYPMAQVETSDLLIGTKTIEVGEPTKSFLVSDLINLTINTIGATGATGYFETTDLKGVTVENGIITEIVSIG
jgi:hypothetical protein